MNVLAVKPLANREFAAQSKWQSDGLSEVSASGRLPHKLLPRATAQGCGATIAGDLVLQEFAGSRV